MVEFIWQWWQFVQAKREAGQGMVEYALILVLVSLVAIVALTQLGTGVNNVFSSANNSLNP